ncbi:MAG: CoA transferase [Halieaceae bacterium]|nr:CoA transferase [Halieaceae bacterium]MBT5557274.1 CoA transferase [Halieaceae bacterium]
MAAGALNGIKVVELAGIGPGPCAGMMLADMGAQVTVIDRPVPDKEAAAVFAKYAIFNRGKQSVALNLKDPDAVEALLRIIDDADVLIEGFRPGVMERLGLGPEVCCARNPKLVYGRMTGWGQTGPLSHAAGHDPNYIALTGALWAGGSHEQRPTAPLTLIGDLGGGTMMLVFGILSAVIHAKQSGEGQIVDAAITDGSAYISTLLWGMHNSGQMTDVPGSGWADFGSPWHDTYQCADGKYVTVCALEPQFYALLIQALKLTEDPVFADQWNKAQWPAGKARFRDIFAAKTRQQWCDQFEGTDVCFAPVLNFSEALEHPHNVARETFFTRDGIAQPSPAPKLSRTPGDAGEVPVVGANTAEVLGALGLDSETLAKLNG